MANEPAHATSPHSTPSSTTHNTVPPVEASAFRLLVESVTDYAIFMLDRDGRVLTWNRGAQRMKGYLPEEIIGKHFSVFYPPDAMAQRWPWTELELAARDGRFEDNGWRVRKDGTLFWANAVLTALRDSAGNLIGFGKVSRDLSERRQAEQQLRESEERFRLLVESTLDYAIFVLDPDGRVASWNPGAQRIKGYTADEIIGRHFSTFYTPEAVASARASAGSRTRAGACARTAAGSGRTSSSRRCAARTARCAVREGHPRHQRAEGA